MHFYSASITGFVGVSYERSLRDRCPQKVFCGSRAFVLSLATFVSLSRSTARYSKDRSRFPLVPKPTSRYAIASSRVRIKSSGSSSPSTPTCDQQKQCRVSRCVVIEQPAQRVDVIVCFLSVARKWVHLYHSFLPPPTSEENQYLTCCALQLILQHFY